MATLRASVLALILALVASACGDMGAAAPTATSSATATPSTASATATPSTQPEPSATVTPASAEPPCQSDESEKSNQRVGLQFDGSTPLGLCIWWEAEPGADAYTVEITFTAIDVVQREDVAGSHTSLRLDLDAVPALDGHDLDEAQRAIEVSVWALVDGEETLLGTVALDAR